MSITASDNLGVDLFSTLLIRVKITIYSDIVIDASIYQLMGYLKPNPNSNFE